MRKLGWIALWLVQIALAAMFLGAGATKFQSPMWARMFARWGYPDHFYLVIGVVEVVGALALLVPRAAGAASLMLIVVMIGAGVTHALHGEQQRLPEIVILSLMLAVVAYVRWPDSLWKRVVNGVTTAPIKS